MWLPQPVQASFLAHPEGYEARRYCWLSVQKGMLVSFLAPVAALITVTLPTYLESLISSLRGFDFFFFFVEIVELLGH